MYVGITREQIIEIHDLLIAEDGGMPGIKEPGYIDLIVEKPFSEYYGEEQYPGLFLKAAVLMEAIIHLHAFNDANKRTSVLTCLTFLALNQYQLEMDIDVLVETAVAVATKVMDLEGLSKWLEQHSEYIGG